MYDVDGHVGAKNTRFYVYTAPIQTNTFCIVNLLLTYIFLNKACPYLF